MKRSLNKIIWVSVFSIAMAYLEAAVVVYLRRVYGISDLILQIPPFDQQIAAIEVGRELATLVMLLSIGWIAGKTFQSRIGFTFITFGLWDIFYYLWLRIFIGWPQSVLEPDLLFLIPLPWWGPVLAPVLIALLMVIGGIFAVIKVEKNGPLHIDAWSWVCLITGVLILLYTFMADALRALPADASTLSGLKPSQFNWPVYFLGFGLGVIALWRMMVGRRGT
ncbi:MAG TPA: hypothetical protein DCL08_08215 [Anaerolineaceae bacterium]|jgi:hypothetical protein|nr:hypothetical protein [Anaerolineaceae bacterium]